LLEQRAEVRRTCDAKGQPKMTDQSEEVVGHIQRVVDGIHEQKGLPRVPLQRHSELLDARLGLDSLDLAVIVTQLEELTGRDPFKGGFRHFTTVGELADLYAATAD
jgi:acyl carrier protein